MSTFSNGWKNMLKYRLITLWVHRQHWRRKKRACRQLVWSCCIKTDSIRAALAELAAASMRQPSESWSSLSQTGVFEVRAAVQVGWCEPVGFSSLFIAARASSLSGGELSGTNWWTFGLFEQRVHCALMISPSRRWIETSWLLTLKIQA